MNGIGINPLGKSRHGHHHDHARPMAAQSLEAPLQQRTTGSRTAKRVYDVVFAGLGLIALSPLFLLIAVVIKLSDGGAVLYRQKRIGQGGAPFVILKFRSMVPGADKTGPAVTGDGDRRITPLGRILRRSKLDELPQLWNVLRGEMSLVGPRPEVARYVEQYSADQETILEHKPGITDLASLRFREEETLLKSSEDAELFYVQHCVPRKLKLNRDYAQKANLLTDTWIILQTLCPYWAGVLAVYAFILGGSLWFSEALAGNIGLWQSPWDRFFGQALVVVGLQLICLLGRRQGKGLLCYFALSELGQICLGLVEANLILLGLSLLVGYALPPRNVLMMDFCNSVLFLAGFRVLLRLWRERAEDRESTPDGPQLRVGIIGAGSLGAQLARCFNSQRNLGRTVVAFFDDDFSKWQKRIHEVPVVGMPECLLQGWSEKLDEVAIALPHGSPARLRQIQQLFEKTNLKVYTIQLPWLA
jgi:lipopolysaccharide/colanic/teichoic acid biosynthesis glycosyltransferase